MALVRIDVCTVQYRLGIQSITSIVICNWPLYSNSYQVFRMEFWKTRLPAPLGTPTICSSFTYDEPGTPSCYNTKPWDLHMSLCWNGMPSAFCSLVPNTFKGISNINPRSTITQTASTIPAAPTALVKRKKCRKQPMLTLIMGRSMVESEFQNCVVVGGMSVVFIS